MNSNYDNPEFFNAYANMDRSKYGLDAAGEWHELKEILPDFTGKRVLDLGCGYGWHCRYAADHGARQVIGVDSSEKMIEQARSMTENENIAYKVMDMFDFDKFEENFDVIISSLAIHYIADYVGLIEKVYKQGEISHWPVDRYFSEGERNTDFLGFTVTKYHRTMMTYVQAILHQGLVLDQVIELTPTQEMLASSQDMQEELRRPMMLILAAHKNF